MKYELVNYDPRFNLYRIRALKDFSDVSKGDLGGWVSNEHNLSQEGDCWIYGYGVVSNTSIVTGDSTLHYAIVSGDSAIHDSTIRNSTIRNSAVRNSAVTQGSTVKSSTVKSSNITNSDATDSVVDNSIVTNSTVTDEVVNSGIRNDNAW